MAIQYLLVPGRVAEAITQRVLIDPGGIVNDGCDFVLENYTTEDVDRISIQVEAIFTKIAHIDPTECSRTVVFLAQDARDLTATFRPILAKRAELCNRTIIVDNGMNSALVILVQRALGSRSESIRLGTLYLPAERAVLHKTAPKMAKKALPKVVACTVHLAVEGGICVAVGLFLDGAVAYEPLVPIWCTVATIAQIGFLHLHAKQAQFVRQRVDIHTVVEDATRRVHEQLPQRVARHIPFPDFDDPTFEIHTPPPISIWEKIWQCCSKRISGE